MELALLELALLELALLGTASCCWPFALALAVALAVALGAAVALAVALGAAVALAVALGVGCAWAKMVVVETRKNAAQAKSGAVCSRLSILSPTRAAS